MRWVGPLVAAVSLLTAGAVSAKQTKVAVLDFTAAGLGEAAAKALSTNLTNIVAAEVARIGYDVISSTDINAMLSYERKKDLLGCEDDTTCLAELGGALGSDLMVAGAIGRLGSTFNLTLSLVDIKRAQVKERFQGSAGTEASLASTARRGVQVLFGKQQDVSGTGTLYVRTKPSGAKLVLDGRDVGTSPAVIDNVPAGDHTLVAAKGELSARTSVFLRPDAIERIEVPLRSAPPVRLKVFSQPLEAEVLLDGKAVGHTPLMLQEVPAGTHTLVIRLAGYRELQEKLQLSYDEYEARGKAPFKVAATLEPLPVDVAVRGLPTDAKVTVDGEEGAFPLRLVPGKREMVFSAHEHESARMAVTIPVGEPVHIEVSMRRFPVVKLAGVPDVAKVLVDGESVTIRSFRLPPGRHQLTVSAHGHNTLEKSIEVVSGANKTVFAKPTAIPVYEKYLEKRNSKQRWMRAWGGIGALLGAGGAGMFVWALLTKAAMRDAHAKYGDARPGDNIAKLYNEAEGLREDVLWRETASYALIGGAALSAALCIYATATVPDDPLADKSVKVGVLRHERGLAVAVAGSF